jgi:hypothetical protein
MLQRQGKLFAFYDAGRPFVSDFANHYNAGVLARRAIAGGVNIYDPRVQDDSLQKVIAPVKPELPFYLQYPPYFFTMTSWLPSFDLFAGWLVWALLGMLLVLPSIAALALGTFSTKPAVGIATAAVLAAYPTWLSFRMGQTSLWAFPALVAFWFFLRANKPVPAGVAAAILLVKLQYGPIVWLLGLILGKARFVAAAAGTLLLMLLISGLTLGWDNLLRYPAALLTADTSHEFSGVPVWLMQNFRGQLALLVQGETTVTRLISGLLVFATAFGVIWIWYKRRHSFETLASVTTLALLASSLHTFAQDYIFAAIPCIWLWGPAGEAGNAPTITRRVLIVSFPVISWAFFIFQKFFAIARIEPFLLWAIALALVALARRLPVVAQEQGADSNNGNHN